MSVTRRRLTQAELLEAADTIRRSGRAAGWRADSASMLIARIEGALVALEVIANRAGRPLPRTFWSLILYTIRTFSVS